jgi:hypothetical protein
MTHIKVEMRVERIEAETSFSYRWHPYPVLPEAELAAEPMTLAEFRLDDAPAGGTRLSIVESGFDRLPPHRRDEVFRMNNPGWDSQLGNVRKHVES